MPPLFNALTIIGQLSNAKFKLMQRFESCSNEHMDENTLPDNCHLHVTIPRQTFVDLKIMAILTNRTMSQLIRIAIQEKMKTLKGQK